MGASADLEESSTGHGFRSFLGVVAIIGVVASLIAAVLVGVGSVVTDEVRSVLPEPAIDVSSIDDLDAAIETDIASPSVVYAADGTILGRFRAETHHERIESDEIPRNVELAVLAAEDHRFWEHGGFDVAAMARALVANLHSGEIVQGGSTITQQLAKMLFTDGERALRRKLSELATAVALEDRFDKDEILAAYLNATYFGQQAIGIAAAAQTYFRSDVADLTLAQAATLAGVIPSPSRYDPRIAPKRAEQRRRQVLDRIEELGWVSEKEMETARAEVVEVKPRQKVVERHGYYLDYVRRFLLDVAEIPPEELFGAGLEIHTALDPRIQRAARAAVAEWLPDPDGPSGAVIVANPWTGHVEALIGGRDFANSEVNLALGRLGAGTGRQPGSSFKSFVLATAFEMGASPQDVIDAPEEYLPTTVDDPKPVHNYSNRGYGRITLRTATINSVNTAFVNLIEHIGTTKVAARAKKAGIRTLPAPDAVGPSLAIGAYETSPLEMVHGYASFATEGRAVKLSPIVEILDRNGKPALELEQPGVTKRRVWTTDTARLVTDLLVDNAERGTATRTRLEGRPVAAKTGTSNNHENAWLLGYTPQRVAAVWVGHPEGNVSMQDVNGFSRVTGGSIPAAIWHDVMAVAHENLEPKPFAPAPFRDRSTVLGSPSTTTPPTTRTAQAPPTTSTSTTTAPTTTTTPTTTSSTTTSTATSTSTTTTTTAPTSTTAPTPTSTTTATREE